MKEKTLTALKASITHWKEDFGVAMDDAGCALCQRFNHGTGHLLCTKDGINGEECPVMLRTGSSSCKNTPFQLNPSLERRADMINFLESLLPSRTTKAKEGGS